jgi:hypothetical protein
MLDLESIYKNESVEDVLLHFALRAPYPSIDRMYVNYKFEVIEHGELLRTHQRLFDEGKLKKQGGHFQKKVLTGKSRNSWLRKNTVLNRLNSL